MLYKLYKPLMSDYGSDECEGAWLFTAQGQKAQNIMELYTCSRPCPKWQRLVVLGHQLSLCLPKCFFFPNNSKIFIICFQWEHCLFKNASSVMTKQQIISMFFFCHKIPFYYVRKCTEIQYGHTRVVSECNVAV